MNFGYFLVIFKYFRGNKATIRKATSKTLPKIRSAQSSRRALRKDFLEDLTKFTRKHM